MENFKSYGYLPIILRKDMPILTNHEEFHSKRLTAALTEVIANLACIKNENIRKILALYSVCLVEDEDGSRIISASFPEKRFT